MNRMDMIEEAALKARVKLLEGRVNQLRAAFDELMAYEKEKYEELVKVIRGIYAQADEAEKQINEAIESAKSAITQAIFDNVTAMLAGVLGGEGNENQSG